MVVQAQPWLWRLTTLKTYHRRQQGHHHKQQWQACLIDGEAFVFMPLRTFCGISVYQSAAYSLTLKSTEQNMISLPNFRVQSLRAGNWSEM